MKKPIKRHEALQPLSRDHHHGLLLSWKIREGLKKDITTKRIKDYCNFFFKTQLVPHFAFEEKEVFTLLDENHPMIDQALAEHKRLTYLFTEEENIESAIQTIEKELLAHIRFEERVLFNEIQEQTSEEVLRKLEKIERDIITPDPDNWEDKFWEKQK